MNILLIAIIMIALIALIKIAHLKHKLILIALLFFFLFFYLTFTFVMQNNSINVASSAGLYDGFKAYFSWASNSLTNLKSLTGNVIGMDWIPSQDTITNSTDIPRQIMRG
jgi:hypothetical protein